MIKSYDVVPLHKVYIPEAAGTGMMTKYSVLHFMGNLEVYALRHIFALDTILIRIFLRLNVMLLLNIYGLNS